MTPTHLTGRQGFPRKGPAGVVLGFVAVWPVSQLLGSARPPRKRPDGMPVAGPAGLYEACAWAETPTVVYPVLEKIKTATKIGTKALGGHGTVWRRWGRTLESQAAPGNLRKDVRLASPLWWTAGECATRALALARGHHLPSAPKEAPFALARESTVSLVTCSRCVPFGFCVLSCRS